MDTLARDRGRHHPDNWATARMTDDMRGRRVHRREPRGR